MGNGWEAVAKPRIDCGMWPFYSDECKRAIMSLLDEERPLTAYRANKAWGPGPRGESYASLVEGAILHQFHAKHAVAVGSGTAALHLALECFGVRGKEVVTTPFSFSATVSAILLAGGIPRFADVDPQTFTITEETVKHVLTKRTACILPVHLFGGTVAFKGLESLGVPIIEDACQSVGARMFTRPQRHKNMAGEDVYAGCGGVAGVYSFNGGKNVPAGEGGALVTNDARIAEKARRLANHAENFGSRFVGHNYRMPELTACVAYHGLLALRERNLARISLAEELTGRVRNPRFVARPHQEYDGRHVFYQYPFTLRNFPRKRFAQKLWKFGVRVGEGYITPPLHKYPAFKGCATGRLPVVERLSNETLCLLDCVRPPAMRDEMRSLASAIDECLV